MKGRYLITTDNWFLAPDGKQYKAAWGNIEVLEDNFLGLKTNRNSTNWYAKVGDGNNHVIIAGCQIHYAVKCNEKPSTESGEDWQADAASGLKVFNTPSKIYIAQS